MFDKIRPVRIPKWLALAEGQSCVRCGVQDGTVVAAHYSGLHAHQLGKGGSIKGHDCCVADLCGNCHSHFDQHRGGNNDANSLDFAMCVMKTVARRMKMLYGNKP